MRYRNKIVLISLIPALVVSVVFILLFAFIRNSISISNTLFLIIVFLIIAFSVVLTIFIARKMMRPFDDFINLVSKLSLSEMNEESIAPILPELHTDLYKLYDGLYRLINRLNLFEVENGMEDGDVNLFSENVAEIMINRTSQIEEANKKLKRINEKINEELEMARRIQENLLPSDRNFVNRSEFEVGSSYESMESVGGDLYDIIRTGRNGYGFLIADVSGHGIAAALITMLVKVSFNSHSGWDVNPSEVCKRVNQELISMLGGLQYFVTAFYSTLNLETGVLQYTNAGHHPILLLRSSDGVIVDLITPGPILGVFDDADYKYSTIELEPNDRILFYTDGILEARNPKGEMFGSERLMNFLKQFNDLPPKDFVDRLTEELAEFGQGFPHDDDRAVLYVHFVNRIDEKHQNHNAVHIEARRI